MISVSLPTPSTDFSHFGNVLRGRTLEVSGRDSACLGLEAGRGVVPAGFVVTACSALWGGGGLFCCVVDHTTELLALLRGVYEYKLGCWSGNKLRTYRADLPEPFHSILELRRLRHASPGSAGPSLTTARAHSTPHTALGPPRTRRPLVVD